jgi:hypothetical protein
MVRKKAVTTAGISLPVVLEDLFRSVLQKTEKKGSVQDR